MQKSEECTHARTEYYGPGKRYCASCGAHIRPPARKLPRDRPNLVNGYALSDSDYELVRGYRRERDRRINAAKNVYQAQLESLLALVKRSTVTNG